MAIPVARVHLKVAHAALPALLPTPPKWKMLPLLPTPCVAAAAILQAKTPAKPSRADADERWDAHKNKTKTNVRSFAGRRSSRKSSTTSPPKPGRADSAERWDAHKKAASPASSSSSCSGTSPISRASSGERWDVHKKRCPPQAELLDDGESSSTGSNDIDDTEEEEEEIVWKPRAMYAGPGFAAAAPEPSMLPMPTSVLVPVA
ncbi:hypothetical protein BDA96_05G042200 [Sorghum bicolor]|uniref:Uncharacterized protein n=2 Tax=Sorghum bicolor TaxID=4558 RepID=A0A921QVT6_SORBI|nr:hypothetical protein BDA96_05G042200 [Sorghum bicolor]KXG27763.1 hypothetical protein SORBI_3005G039900 [Sorghum bicolor]